MRWYAAAVFGLAVMSATPARADVGDFRGTVVDAATGEGIGGALIAADAGTAESGADGRFTLVLDGVRARRLSVFVFAEGYAPATAELRARLPARIELRRDATAVEVIEVSGRPPDLGSPTSYAVSAEQIRSLPGTGNDVLRALQSMPGVARNTFGIGGLVLRGASPHETNIYLDGIEVPLAYHFGGVTSFYPSTLLDEISLSPGGSDVMYGRGIGGVVELRSRKARRDRYRVGGEVGVFDASVFAEGPVGGGGAAVGLRRSYADAFLGELLPEDRQVLPRYYDGQLRWDHAAAGGTLSLLAFFSDDRIIGWGGTDFRQGFGRVAARWERSAGGTTISLTPFSGWGSTTVDYVLEHTDERPDLEQRMRLDRTPLGLRADLRRDTGWGHVAAGLDAQGGSVTFRQSADLLSGSEEEVRDFGSYVDFGAWAEARWRIEDGKLTLKPGLRADFLGIAEAYAVEPRLAATHELAEGFTLRTTFGYHHQPPGPVAAVGGRTGRRNTLNVGDGRGKVVQGLHTSVGARVELPAAVVASVTGYHVLRRGPPSAFAGLHAGEDLTDLLPLPIDVGPVLANVIGEEFEGVRDDTRRGAGVEVSVQRKTDRWLMWLSYTLSTIQTRPTGPSRHSWTRMDLDQTHNLNLVASVRLGSWQLGARFRYTSGFPYTPRRIGLDDDGLPTLIEGAINSVRLADYRSLDLRVDRAWRRRWGTLACFVDVQNVTNAANEEGVNYEFNFDFEDPDLGTRVQRGLPILPMIGFSFQPAA